MQIIHIGHWQFELPDDFSLKPNENSQAYFENEEGTVGIYLKLIALSEPKPSATLHAKYIQEVHLGVFTKGATNTWEIVDQRQSTDGYLARSALDLYDEAANYRVISLVAATTDMALQTTVHDYWCENYHASRHQFSDIEASIVTVASAA